MSEEIRSIIALLSGAIVFVLCYVKLFLKGKPQKQAFIEKARKQGNYVTGTLMKTKRILGNDESGNSYFQNDRLKCTYEYKVDGISYKKKLIFQSPGLVSIKFPYTVTVYYDPKKPAKGICQEEPDNQRSIGCLGTIVLAALAFIAVYHLLIFA